MFSAGRGVTAAVVWPAWRSGRGDVVLGYPRSVAGLNSGWPVTCRSVASGAHSFRNIVSACTFVLLYTCRWAW